MPPRKVVEVDPNSLAASRTRRANAGVPSRAFDEISERFDQRTKRADKDTKAAAAEEIEADPHTGDDTLARKPLTDFFAPTLTGDNETDRVNYDQARTEYLTHYLAVRDGLDVRSAIRSAKIGLPELEEIYLDPEAALGLLSDDEEPSHVPNIVVKGKQKAKADNNPLKEATKPPQAQTGYTGITVDQNDHTVKAKFAPKPATSVQSGNRRPLEEEDGPRKIPRISNAPQQTHAVETGPPQQPTVHPGATPLRRTDSTTYVHGRRVELPVYFSRNRAPHSPNTTVLLVNNPPPVQSNPPAKTPSRAANGPWVPQEAGHGSGVSARSKGVGNPSLGRNAALNTGQPAHGQQRAARNVPRVSLARAHHAADARPHPVPANHAPKSANQPHHAHSSDRIQRGQPTSDNRQQSKNPAPPRPSNKNTSHKPHQPAQVNQVRNERLDPAQRVAPCNNPQGNLPLPVEESDIDREEWSEEEAEAAPAANPKGKSKQGSGRATIKSFPEEEQPIVRDMARRSRARIVANGTYDDTTATLYAPYAAWPDTWKRRETREAIVSDCLTKACEEFNLPLRFQPRHVKCVNALITTHRSQAIDWVKSCVDRVFGFTIEWSDRNRKLTKALLPFNFHYKDVFKKTGPFQNPLIPEVCRAVAFEKESSVGARYPDNFVDMPATYMAYACVLSHHVIFSYRTGQYESKKLSVPVQQSIFRRALKFLITMEEKQQRASSNVRGKVFDYCVDGLKKKPEVRDSSSEPEREWSPDQEEVYVSRYAGADGGQPRHVDGDEGADDTDGDEQEELEHVNWQDGLLAYQDTALDEAVAGPSGTSHDEDIEMQDIEMDTGEEVDELEGDYDDRGD
ncbi:hypothetical protein FS749_002487 [Ceratobasidium sp. UAMH 11750]|nr:hypothetical protein FS749_002487 [Ceratobasidium sp. UAMH 11750]